MDLGLKEKWKKHKNMLTSYRASSEVLAVLRARKTVKAYDAIRHSIDLAILLQLPLKSSSIFVISTGYANGFIGKTAVSKR